MKKEREETTSQPSPVPSPYFDKKKDGSAYDYVRDHRLNKTKNYKRIMGESSA